MSELRFLIDLTTSREYKGQNPVGIVRAEREIAKAFLSENVEVAFFWFDTKASMLCVIPRHEAIEIVGAAEIAGAVTIDLHPADAPRTSNNVFKTGDTGEAAKFLQSVKSKVLGGDAQPQQADIPDTLERDLTFELFDDDVIISAGLLWDGNYLEVLYLLKKTTKFFFIQIVYDIVPMLMPEFCVPGMNVRFPRFILDAAWTADAIYCISNNTLTDLDKYLCENMLPRPRLERITLGADLVLKQPPGSSHVRTELMPGRFVVYVSTIEPRKNHIMLFHVWRQIYLTHPDDLLTLVIVGRHGWNASDLINTIQSADHLYPEYIKIWTEVSDADLDWLYSNSKFTVYPSLYEGWGLPVAESLIRGKFCVASSTSSLPEVAGGLAHLLDPLDLPEWIRTVHHYMVSDAEVLAKEQVIRANYKPALWDDAMREFVGSVGEVCRSLQAASNVVVGAA